jgi:hypothetical protein
LVFGGYLRDGLSLESKFTADLIKEVADRTRGGGGRIPFILLCDANATPE